MTSAGYFNLYIEWKEEPLECLKKDDINRFEFLNDHAGYRAPMQLYRVSNETQRGCNPGKR